MPLKPLEAQTSRAGSGAVEDKLRPTSEMHLMIGGPYQHDGETQRYGHTALRILSKGSDVTYDFGRYGRVTGDFGAEGEGILRVWSAFDPYISGENALGRKTTIYVYAIFDHQAKAAMDYYDSIIANGKRRPELERQRSTLKVYQLQSSYHALGYNCTTLSLDGARKAIPSIEDGSREFIKPEAVLTFAERMAMKTVGGGTPGRLFLPANLDAFLSTKPEAKPIRVEVRGG